jgi:hypothetical protein
MGLGGVVGGVVGVGLGVGLGVGMVGGGGHLIELSVSYRSVIG